MNFVDSLTFGAVQHGATPTAGYSLRPPSPPHIHIPPIHGTNAQIVLSEYCGVGDNSEEQEILKIVTKGQLDSVERSDWKYEMRRHFQAVLSFLYLGPLSGAKDIEALKREGITMLLAIRDTKTAQAKILGEKPFLTQLGIEHDTVDVSGNMELIAAFPRAINIINDHLVRVFRQNNPQGIPSDIASSQGPIPKVLVFCESGNERSASVVAAYIMAIYGSEMVQAIQYVQNQRFCIAFDDEMKHTLLNYYDLLKARRSVMEAAAIAIAPVRSKRRHSDDEDEDMDMGQSYQDDVDRFTGRTNFAPFFQQC